MSRICSNCGTTENVAPRSFDLDLPTLVLCSICTYALIYDSELFGDLGRGKRGRGYPEWILNTNASPAAIDSSSSTPNPAATSTTINATRVHGIS